MKKYMQTDFDNFEVDKCSRKICSTGDDAKWVDSVGGIHEDGCGWAPNGDFCGECSNETCENCFVWNREGECRAMKKYTPEQSTRRYIWRRAIWQN